MLDGFKWFTKAQDLTLYRKDDVMRLSPTCVVAQALSLLPPPVEPDAEAHEDDPAGSSDTGDKSRLLHHISDLLRDAVIPVSMHNHVPELLTWGHRDKQASLMCC